jgi:hypothetical protein
MELSVGLLLLVVLLGWTDTGASEAAVSPSWRPVLPAQLSTSVSHRGASAPFRFALHEDELPVHQQSQLIGQDINRDQCALYKVLFTQQLYFEVRTPLDLLLAPPTLQPPTSRCEGPFRPRNDR